MMCWKLTDEDLAQCEAMGFNPVEAQASKKQAYRNAGGIIINPDALSDMYEAVRWVLEDYVDKRAKLTVSTHTQLLKAKMKADGGK